MRALVLAAALVAAVPAPSAAAAERTCWTTEPVTLGVEGAWAYTYEVSWCAEGTEITTVDPAVTHQVLNPVCRWVGSIEESVTKTPDGAARQAFNLSEFSCPADIGAKGVNPWVIILLHADGTYAVTDTGIHL
ncbi:hypothetical protein [Amycolatopsis solani]|uniref:hypothetical protein n=1 Tax=Amycolatopsis solani TaxID=3028615 RepID=UPI0025B1AB55|nr:hypothetical protein [Amycolatopsis sp. MEP2-6]